MGRHRRTRFIDSDYHRADRTGLAGPPNRKGVIAEVAFLLTQPRNRFERRSKARRLKAFLKSAGDRK